MSITRHRKYIVNKIEQCYQALFSIHHVIHSYSVGLDFFEQENGRGWIAKQYRIYEVIFVGLVPNASPLVWRVKVESILW